MFMGAGGGGTRPRKIKKSQVDGKPTCHRKTVNAYYNER